MIPVDAWRWHNRVSCLEAVFVRQRHAVFKLLLTSTSPSSHRSSRTLPLAVVHHTEMAQVDHGLVGQAMVGHEVGQAGLAPARGLGREVALVRVTVMVIAVAAWAVVVMGTAVTLGLCSLPPLLPLVPPCTLSCFCQHWGPHLKPLPVLCFLPLRLKLFPSPRLFCQPRTNARFPLLPQLLQGRLLVERWLWLAGTRCQ